MHHRHGDFSMETQNGKSKFDGDFIKQEIDYKSVIYKKKYWIITQLS